MIVYYICYECNFSGEVLSTNRRVVCPECSTINDWWLDIELPPPNHQVISNSFKIDYNKDYGLCLVMKKKSGIKEKVNKN